MPSPFPGMDPYLERPSLWPDVHHELISETRAFLQGILRPKYYVRVEERVYLTDEDRPGRKDRPREPDVRIGERPGHAGGPFTPESATAIAEPVKLRFPTEEEIREAFLKVFDAENQQVVTVLEILSPTNKVAGSAGRLSFQQKRQEVLNSPSHWVEIDLLRLGTPSVPREILSSHYAVHVLRVQKRPETETWPISLQQQLPVVRIPLKSGDPDASLDLQRVLSSAYDRAGYDLTVDYRADPVPPLAAEDAAWAHQWLQSKGLR